MELKESVQLGGAAFSMETGKVAKQADGAVIVRYGDTMVLVSAVGSVPREGIDFFPLTVEYREYGYAAGRIPGNYFRREGRPSEKETLTSRLIDRPIRPLFREGYNSETQVVALVLSADESYDSDVLSITGASAALYLSDIPFDTPVAGVRVGLIEDRFIVNPTYDQVRSSEINLIVAGSEEAICMVEAGAKEVSEDVMVEALMFGHNEIKKLCRLQKEMAQKLGVTKREVVKPELDAEMLAEIESKITEELRESLDTSKRDKIESYKLVDELKAKTVSGYPEDDAAKRKMAATIFNHVKEKIFREDILNRRHRPDGRRFSEIRPISIDIGWLPRTHGSALFTRGETQAIVTATLGTSEDIQYMDDLEKGEVKRRFLLAYNFPPFSVGETGRIGSPGRREIGHGALARRALEPMLPGEESWPYTIRIVSDITESNGSSSMASVCGGTLALMDAGVPIKAPVAGVAMGLVMEGNKYAILTDIAGAEDHYGDMDFKVTGTRDGITALQMDIKVTGINAQILADALQQARTGRLYILDKMDAVITAPREEISPYAPRILTIQIPVDKIRDVIGPGGKVIRGLVERTGCKIDVDDKGRINIASSNLEKAEQAKAEIEQITAVPEVGKTYLGTVQRIADFGAFVEIIPGTDGLLHVSEIAEYRVRDVRDELTEGQQLLVKVINVDPSGKIRLSRRAVIREERGETDDDGDRQPDFDRGNRDDRPREREDRGPRGPRRDTRDRPAARGGRR
ncbi:MAG TPA: polyribonucleotide nucleotidyltransferase [Blastocatellia bacterium]|jgi:polyribonucleotide nucleotidyltransferase|nr:polyribonucleotide nucleotidyltransferase [Blastocatellia bacterium]